MRTATYGLPPLVVLVAGLSSTPGLIKITSISIMIIIAFRAHHPVDHDVSIINND